MNRKQIEAAIDYRIESLRTILEDKKLCKRLPNAFVLEQWVRFHEIIGLKEYIVSSPTKKKKKG